MARFFFNCTGGRTYDDDEYSYRTHADQSSYKQGNDPDWTGGNERALVMFNSTDIRTRLTGFRVTACSLDYYVTDIEGSQATMVWGTHNYTSLPANWSWSRVFDDRIEFQKFGTGRVTGMNLGVTIGTELKDAVSTGLLLGPAWEGSDADNFITIAPDGDVNEPVLIIDADSLNVAPLAPTLQEPAANAVINAQTTALKFRWAHSDPNGDIQAGWQFRRKKTDGSFDYWNGTAFQAIAVTLTQATAPIVNGYMTVPAGVWANGIAYEWSVATQDPAGLLGPFAAGRILYTSAPPTTTTTEPTSATTSRPTVRWTYTDPEGTAQYGWAVQVVASEVYSAVGYNPDNYTSPVWSASADTNATAAVVGTDLVNHKRYRAYVRTASSPNPAGGLQFSPWSYQQFDVVIPPYPSSVTYPANGATHDLRSGFRLEWKNSFFGNIGAQTAFAVRRIVAGGQYQYWNGATWGSTEVFIAGSSPFYAFRANEVVNGATYTFSIRIRDDYNQVSPYSTGVTVTGSTAATVSVLAPTGVTVVTNPTITWSVFDLENDPQQTYRIRIIASDVFTSGAAIDPLTAVAVWDSTEVVSADIRNLALPVNLTNNAEYRAYVRVKTGGIYSDWSYSQFNIILQGPAQPSATLLLVPEFGAVDIFIQGRDSLLSDVVGRNAAGWQTDTNCTVTNNQFYSSAQGKLMSSATATALGTMTVRTTDSWLIAPSVQYTAAITTLAKLGAAAVNTYVSIEWLDADGVVFDVSSGNVIADDAAVRSSVTAVAPSDAARARIRVTFQAVPIAGAIHQFFDPVLRPGTGSEWSPGGLLGSTMVSVAEMRNFRIVRRGLNIPIPTDTQRVTLRDEEVGLGIDQVYEIVTRAVYPNAVLSGPEFITDDIRWSSGWLWLSDPLRASSARAFGPQKFSAVTRPVRQGKFRPIGRPDAIIVTGVRALREGSFTIVTDNRADREAFRDLTDNSEIILLRIPPDQGEEMGETLYIRLEGDGPEDRPLASRTTHRTIEQAWVEQTRPLDYLEYIEDDSDLV
jgi:hypothetical protein